MAKRCYYEVLEVSKEANDEDLKKSYRKLALKWHPDKNPDDLDEAKREFILIQQAFEILSDPQDRAFYDRHRESILKGATSGFTDESLDVFEYFTSSCYSGFDDNENGFYSVYREVFNKLAFEESEYLFDDDQLPPDFGNSTSPHDEVNNFYGHWRSLEAEWSKFSNFENRLKDIENVVASEFNDHDDSGESEIDELFCMACNKSFRTEKTFANHEKSKKHKENVALLKETMLTTEENLLYGNDLVLSDENCDESNADVSSVLEEDTGLVENVNSRSRKRQRTSKKKKKNVQPLASSESEIEEIDLHEVAVSKRQKKRLEREKILTNTEKKLSPRTIKKLKQMIKAMKPPPPEPKYMKDLIDFTGIEHRCEYCNQSFVSNKRLLKHLHSTRHGVYLAKETVSSSTSKSSRNRR